jgi:hypothetical protein
MWVSDHVKLTTGKPSASVRLTAFSSADFERLACATDFPCVLPD